MDLSCTQGRQGFEARFPVLRNWVNSFSTKERLAPKSSATWRREPIPRSYDLTIFWRKSSEFGAISFRWHRSHRVVPYTQIQTALMAVFTRPACTSRNGDLFTLNHDLARTASSLKHTRLVLSLGQCSRPRRYIVTQALGTFRQIKHCRDHVPALQFVRLLHHANAVVPVP